MLIILDRDGVINHDSEHYIKSPDEWHPISGSVEAIGRLTKAGYKVVVAMNQSGVGRGLYSIDTLNAMHKKMIALVEKAGGAIDKIYFCPHHPDDGCGCRKPKPGMLNDILRDYDLTKDDCLFIGDSIRDFDAAKAVGCQFMLLKTGNGMKSLAALKDDVVVADDLSHAVALILNSN